MMHFIEGIVTAFVAFGMYKLITWAYNKKFWVRDKEDQVSLKDMTKKRRYPDNIDVIAVKAMTSLIESGRYEENIKVCENYEEAATRTAIQSYELAEAMMTESENHG